MERKKTAKIHADWKAYSPESHKHQVGEEDVEVVNIVLIIVVSGVAVLSVLLGGLCCWFVRFFSPATKAAVKKAKELDERIIFGEDMTRYRDET
jgi:hypothetical protein